MRTCSGGPATIGAMCVGARAEVRRAHRDLFEEAPVDLADDLQMAGEDVAEHGRRPLLERFGKERVVRVADAADDDVPGCAPVQAVDVHEDAHQLGDRRARGACR